MLHLDAATERRVGEGRNVTCGKRVLARRAQQFVDDDAVLDFDARIPGQFCVWDEPKACYYAVDDEFALIV